MNDPSDHKGVPWTQLKILVELFTWAYQGARNVYFSKNFANIHNE